VGIKTNLKSRLHQLYKQKESKNHHLQYLFLEITKKCNLSCLHCGSDCKKEVNSPELTTESWYKIIDYIKEQFSTSVGFIITGGEPLMHPDLIKIGTHIKNNGMRWGMVTNGMALTWQKLEKLLNAGISSITLSLDGTEAAHNWLRNNNKAFCNVTGALKLVAESEIHFKDVVTCVTHKSINKLDDIAELLIGFGIPKWRLFRIFPSGRANDNKELSLDFAQTQLMLKWIEKNKPQLQKRGLNVNLSCEGWVPFEQDQKIRDFSFFCRSGINIASILADGAITGCSNNSEGFHVGNIINDNFKKVWEEKFDIFRKKEWLCATICNDCEYLKDCNGSSVHLWELGEKKPKFCYARDVKK
jgi:radical SAM protein with 4Fe4S-binding SPASM domain